MLRKSHCALRMALWASLRQASFACLTILKQVVTQGSAACLFMEATSSCSPRPIHRPFPHRVPRAACRHFWGRVRSQKLMPCYLGQAARRLIGRVWLRAVAVFELRQSPFLPRRTGGARCITTIRQCFLRVSLYMAVAFGECATPVFGWTCCYTAYEGIFGY